MDLISGALALAESSLRIFPCHYPIFKYDGSVICSCYKRERCKSIGKHPAFKGWQKDATNNPSIIRKIWTKNPKYNIGILTGEPNNIDVLDVDPKNNGLQELDNLEKENEPFPLTTKARSGSGGLHLFFIHTPGPRNNNDGKIKPGIDFKTTGGYIIAPPSKHPSGNYYQWLNAVSPALPPDWFVELLFREFPPQYSKQRRDKKYWTSLAYGTAEGDRHNAIASIAGLLLNDTNLKSKELAIALVHGFNQVCCKPPKSEEEVDSIIRYIGKEHQKNNDKRN